jgi:plasmid stabilization system protein ParE
MSLRFTPQALADAKRAKSWWRRCRPAAPGFFERELDEALERIAAAPATGVVYGMVDTGAEIRRVLMPKTRNHVYYAVEGEDVVLLSVWGAPRGRGPRL